MVPVGYREVIRIHVRNTAKLTLCCGPVSPEDSVVSPRALILPDAIARIGLRDRNREAHACRDESCELKKRCCVSTSTSESALAPLAVHPVGMAPSHPTGTSSGHRVPSRDLHQPKQLRGAHIINFIGHFWRKPAAAAHLRLATMR
ncbi:hypothetical protein B0H10DRAFT_2027952 [Mycena sp. CBHHK59/15]|nr:hypothetical protein B0H10DRAFT_2027952 [Mycena sp. CBHHK59/15]